MIADLQPERRSHKTFQIKLQDIYQKQKLAEQNKLKSSANSNSDNDKIKEIEKVLTPVQKVQGLIMVELLKNPLFINNLRTQMKQRKTLQTLQRQKQNNQAVLEFKKSILLKITIACENYKILIQNMFEDSLVKLKEQLIDITNQKLGFIYSQDKSELREKVHKQVSQVFEKQLKSYCLHFSQVLNTQIQNLLNASLYEVEQYSKLRNLQPNKFIQVQLALIQTNITKKFSLGSSKQ